MADGANEHLEATIREYVASPTATGMMSFETVRFLLERLDEARARVPCASCGTPRHWSLKDPCPGCAWLASDSAEAK